MSEFVVVAMKHGLEKVVRKTGSVGEAIQAARVYHERTGVAVKVYDPNLELISELDDYSPL